MVEIEAAFIRELARCWERENRLRFGGRLKPPVMALSDATTRHGQWISHSRRLELSRPLVLERAWIDIAAILEHEMAHQYVDEVLGVKDETAHGDTFRQVCEERGIDAAAAGDPKGDGLVSDATTRVFDRIRKLLALAGSDNQHEAELAMKNAHQLMLRHNVDGVAAAAAVARGYIVRHLGEPHQRTTRVEMDIVGVLTEFFFVEAIRVPVYFPKEQGHGWVFEVIGTHANVEMALHVHQFLLGTVDRLWAANRADTRVKSGRDRQAYQAGVIAGFREKLETERKVITKQEPGLVWVGDEGLDDFFAARFPRVTRRRRWVRNGGAHAAGREAGRAVVLNKPVTSTGSTGGGRLLRG